jgi:hypothetical protein
MACKLCNDTGDQRYWEGRWRDEKAENERLLAALTEARLQIEYLDAKFQPTGTSAATLARIGAALNNQQS